MQEKEVLIAIVLSLCIFIISTVVIVLFLYRYQKRKHQHKEELLLNEKKFEAELLKTEIEVQEQTRKNLASDLHDNIGQLLSLTNVILASINLNDKEKANQKIADTQELITKSIKELRHLSKIIHGEQLLQLGLVPAIEQEVSWLQRNGFYKVQFERELDKAPTVNTKKDLFLYRLLQESLNNILKHAAADTIIIELKYYNGMMQLSIADNGIGYNVESKTTEKQGLGLLNMRKRVHLLKGKMQIVSAENRGTKTIFIIPYP
jgi:signal transduction histidine kinase